MSRKTPDWTMEVIDEKIIEGQMIVTFDRALQDIDRALSMVSPDLNTRVELLENRRNLTKQRREVAEAYQERQRKYNHNYYNGSSRRTGKENPRTRSNSVRWRCCVNGGRTESGSLRSAD